MPSDKITFTVLYFAALTDLVAARKQNFTAHATLKINELIAFLVRSEPLLSTDEAQKLLKCCACAINLEYVDLDQDEEYVKNGDEVAIIPPVSGG